MPEKYIPRATWKVHRKENNYNHVLCSCRYIGKNDGITISVWNYRKFHKKQNGGFLGCVRILSNTIQRLKDTGCMYSYLFYITVFILT